jgi:hypothetical protein
VFSSLITLSMALPPSPDVEVELACASSIEQKKSPQMQRTPAMQTISTPRCWSWYELSCPSLSLSPLS